MATIVQNIENIKDVKADIRDAIIEKGIDMENVPFTDYAIKISEITGGGSELDKPVATGIFTSAKLLTECLPYGHFNNLNVKVGINSYIQRTKFEFEYRRTNPDVATFFKMSDATEAANLTLTQTSNNLITFNYYNSSNGEIITGSSEINETGEFHTIIVDIPNMNFIVDGVINNLEGVTPSRLLLKSLWLIDAYTIDVKRVDIFDSDNITNIRYIRPTEIGDFAYIPIEWTTGNFGKTLYTPTNSENYEYITTGTPVYFDKICVDNTTKDILEFDVPNNDFYTRVDVTDLKYLDIYSYIQNRVSVEENTQLNNQTATEAITITENGTYTYPMEDGSYIWYSNSSSAPAVNIIDNLFGGWIAAQDDIIEVEFRATNSMIGTKVPWLFGKSDEAFSTTKNKYGIELNQGSSGCWLNFWMGKKLGKYFFKSGQWVKVKTYPNPADTTERIIEIDDGGYNNITTTISNTAMTTNLQKKTQLFGLLSSTSNYGGVLPAIHLKYIKVWSSSEDKENNIYKYGLLATNGMNNIDNCVISTLEGNSVKIECAQVVNLHNYQKGWNNITVDVPSGGTTGSLALVDGTKFKDSTFTEIPDYYDFSQITDMSAMFWGCNNLQTIPQINTSNVTDMSFMFYDCRSLQTIPPIDTSNVTTMDRMFSGCDLSPIPPFDCSSLTNINMIFGNQNRYTTDVGGWIGLKISWTNGLDKLPNLNYQSCINILNGLADVTELGSRTLKVHQNFLDTVGDEINIGINKNWTISA